MNKQEYLKELEKALQGIPQNDIEDSVNYYNEMIDDRIEAGMSESEAVNELGSPKSVAAEIMQGMSFGKIIKSKLKAKRSIGVWEIILLILGSPIWLSLLIAAFVAVLAIYVSLWSVFISFWAVGISFLAVSAVGFATFGATLASSYATALLYLGIGLLFLGAAVLIIMGSYKATAVFAKLSLTLTKKIKNLIIGKERKQ